MAYLQAESAESIAQIGPATRVAYPSVEVLKWMADPAA